MQRKQACAAEADVLHVVLLTLGTVLGPELACIPCFISLHHLVKS